MSEFSTPAETVDDAENFTEGRITEGFTPAAYRAQKEIRAQPPNLRVRLVFRSKSAPGGILDSGQILMAAPLMLFGQNPNGVYLTASLIGFSAGTTISLLLLVLTMQAARLPGRRAANLLFPVCSLVWNLGGLAHAAAITSGAPEQGRLALTCMAFQFSAAAAWPITVFALWSPLATQPWQRIGFRVLQALATLTCAAITIPLWLGVFTRVEYKTLKESTAYNGSILLILGVAVFRERLVSRSMRVPSLAILVSVFGATLADAIQQVLPFDPVVCSVLHVVSEQLTLFIVLGAFFLFARFRFSDLFTRYSLRVMLATVTAAAFLMLDRGVSFLGLEGRAGTAGTARVFVETLAAVAMLFLFAFVDRHLGDYAERWIFHAPNYRVLARDLSEMLAKLRENDVLAGAVETAARRALDLKGVHLVAADKLPRSAWWDAISAGELVELDCRDPLLARQELAEVELLVPVRAEGQVSHVMAVAPGNARRGLVTHEVTFLRTVAAQFGHRLDALRMEERRVESKSREAVLQQQITEAELRALRAQINPHFLFNSLNSIANLVVINPEKAETMTLRLARVFRHVLANSARPLVALHEEIEFLQTYLQIEEARFGSRLHVKIAVDPAIAMEPIPSLILQPIVENALKHGLAPKAGPGNLWITAEATGSQVCLRVEDDGIGPGNGTSRRNGQNGHAKGVGLENVALRLNALYQSQSRITLETREAGGTRVTILLPRESGQTA